MNATESKPQKIKGIGQWKRLTPEAILRVASSFATTADRQFTPEGSAPGTATQCRAIPACQCSLHVLDILTTFALFSIRGI